MAVIPHWSHIPRLSFLSLSPPPLLFSRSLSLSVHGAVGNLKSCQVSSVAADAFNQTLKKDIQPNLPAQRGVEVDGLKLLQ